MPKEKLALSKVLKLNAKLFHLNKIFLLRLALALLITILIVMTTLSATSSINPPIAEKKPYSVTLHGHQRIDNYAWLKDSNWQKVIKDPTQLSNDIRNYLEAENRYLETVLNDTSQLQKDLFTEMRTRIKEDDSSVPQRDGNYYYYVRYEKNQQYPIYCRYRHDRSNHEEILLDTNEVAKEFSYFDIGDTGHSPDHRYFAYSADTKGSEFYSLYIIDLKNNKYLPDQIDNIQSEFVWAQDNRTIFYTTLDENHRPDKVLRHKLDSAVAQDSIVYQESDSGFFVSLDVTESNNYILISAHDHETTEIHVIDAFNPEHDAKLFTKRETGVEYEVSDHKEFFYIVTNLDDAEDYKIMQTSVRNTARDNWKDVYRPKAGTLLRGIYIFKNYLIRSERINGLPKIVIVEIDEQTLNNEHSIEFKEEAYELNVIPGYEFDTQQLRFSYTSMTTPEQIYDYNMQTRERTLKKQQDVPSGHDENKYITRRLFAKSPDDEEIPISLLYKKDTPIDGSAPLLLYAYGSYGNSIPASFSTNRLSLVNRGFIFAIAHVRGGMEKGYAWYRNGKRKFKTNTFADYIACAEYLIRQKFSARGNIAVHGGSAGGMLVGAVLNMQPEIFKAVIADVPFVDVLNTMSDDSLPLTPPEWPEWGNPLLNEEDYLTILKYSPYDNVTPQHYPNILVTAGLTDPRVTYWEAAKWVAKLRDQKLDNNLLLLKTNMQAGHAGASGRYDYLKEIALMYAFLLKVFKIAT